MALPFYTSAVGCHSLLRDSYSDLAVIAHVIFFQVDSVARLPQAEGRPRPVLVWLHGGGMTFGSTKLIDGSRSRGLAASTHRPVHFLSGCSAVGREWRGLRRRGATVAAAQLACHRRAVR